MPCPKNFMVLFLSSGVVFNLIGCGSARVEVVKEKMVAQIDSLIGKMDVERKQIELSMKGLGEGIEGIRKAKIKAKVKRDQLKEESSALDGQLAKVDNALKIVRPHLEAKDSVQINGSSYTPPQVKELAEKLLSERKSLEEKQKGIKAVELSLDQTVSGLEKQQSDYQAKQKKLETQLRQIDAQSIALKAKREAASAVGSDDASFASGLKTLEDKVSSLLAESTAELQGENEKWNENRATKEIDNLDSALNKLKTASDTASEIDKILGPAKK